ncbi:hydrolase Nlp/P60 [Thermobispora bispora]|uniref:NLP/P60 protein n=1 Tax=Thermobispora bispora (strain ATCC 19993 / DSM 43833 / CBS 139.67 / JCM 10125 / KCTC 9307 / NBRC 14880 / R51) TaxID=469371 RepID=D6Y7N8_THEBD|nr:bifunctional lytic transglycosylase/C40 family peptidase [Thermobispora bispora]ADG89749.1 NLP/P60 protein [Thermobispora bispora DSM 43833]MDI9582441.1 bifunctional lytic transglycosylase/C40 family peptidase [Thermobispora sp.]
MSAPPGLPPLRPGYRPFPGPRRESAIPWRLVIVVGGLMPLVLFASLILMTPLPSGLFGGGSRQSCTDTSISDADVSSTAREDIPPDYLELYKKFGQEVGVQWNVLAAIGKRETDHGRSTLPGVKSGTNYAGAAGPMQFLISTWGGKPKIKMTEKVNGYASDGNGDGYADVYEPADAILGAARMLKRNGAPDDLRRALFVYNRATWYVDQVLEIARRYSATGDIGAPPEADPFCQPGYLDAATDEVVKKILEYALAQRGKPYRWGGTGPDAFDCSGIVYMAYRHAGLTIPRTTFEQWPFGVRIEPGSERPGDLVFFNAGPGTSIDRPGHVGLVVAPGKMVEARCARCGPIKVTTYRDRPNLVGFTRPLENEYVLAQLKRSMT